MKETNITKIYRALTIPEIERRSPLKAKVVGILRLIPGVKVELYGLELTPEGMAKEIAARKILKDISAGRESL